MDVLRGWCGGAAPAALEGLLALPNGNPRSAVLVLAGSSGRIETARVELLAAHGAAAMSIRWFGGVDQPAGICEIPLESFAAALDHLARLHDRLAVIGTSKGAEVALLLATRDPRIKAVAAMSPSSVVWANVGAGSDGVITPYRSSWTEQGRPLPFVPYDDDDWVAGNTVRMGAWLWGGLTLGNTDVEMTVLERIRRPSQSRAS